LESNRKKIIMRIIAGNLRGSIINITNNRKTRPLKDIVRESIFNLLIHSKKISFQLKEANILDLYSGTGSFGLECLSREAKYVYFVESEKSAVEVLKQNIKKLKTEKKTKIFFYNVFEFLQKQNNLHSKFDLIFCDPPYKEKNIENLIHLIYKSNLLNKKGTIILHRNKNSKDKLPIFFKSIEERIYGISKIIFGNFLS
tara:strand:- start:2380 stop:2976 length:597 start_codon:yes stop_codon:yes gene_type:complete